MKKKIGISFSETNFHNYWNWFTPEELQTVELIELSFQKNNAEDIAKCDGFVLTGGIDVDPSFYDASADYENGPAQFSPERDRFEEQIYRYAQLNKLPVLGICRALQLVNVLEGGKLIQDLNSEGNAIHRKGNAPSDKEHAVIAEGLLLDITGSATGDINSAHHQAVDPGAMGKNLKANAYADDGKTIEGLEFSDKTNKAFMLCVQWHPERMKNKTENPFSQKIKERFLREVKNTQR
jgi:putative glutamine amidotransferase